MNEASEDDIEQLLMLGQLNPRDVEGMTIKDLEL